MSMSGNLDDGAEVVSTIGFWKTLNRSVDVSRERERERERERSRERTKRGYSDSEFLDSALPPFRLFAIYVRVLLLHIYTAS